jgi:ABC-2 type transport system permease protein
MLYWKIMLNAVQSNTAYRFHTMVTTFNRVLNVLVNASLWTALYAGIDLLSPQTDIPLSQMITYVIISTFISIVVSNGIIWSIAHKVHSGEIAIYLIRPVGLFRATLFEQLGGKLFTILFEAVPVLVIGMVALSLSIPDFAHILLFLLSLVHAYVIYFLLTYLVSLLSFWYLRIFHLEFMLGHIINFFSGIFVPLWFFPDALRNIASLLPFELIYFAPIRIFLEQTESGDIVNMFAKTYLWIALLAGLNIWVYRQGVKKLVIQGG